MAPGRDEAARHRRRRVRDRAEDRRPLDQPHLRGREARARRDAGRRPQRRGRDDEPEDDQGDLDAHAAAEGRAAAAAARGARRGLHAAVGLRRAERAARRRRQEDDAEPAQRGGRLAPAEELADHRGAAAEHLGPRPRPPRRAPDRGPLGRAAVAARAGLPHEPARGAPRVDRVGRASGGRVGAAARGARLRDRRARDQGRLVRAAGAARRAAQPTALGARVQVGAVDRDDDAPEDRDPRRSHGRAEPVGHPRAGRGRRRHRLARDAAQRGGHQPQGHSRGRRGDRPARGRRDPAGRRSGAAAQEADEAVPHARAHARSATRRSSSPRARRCTGARTAPARRAGSSR